MSRLTFTVLLLSITVLSSWARATEEAVELPTQANTPVIELWYLYAAKPSHPEVVILADGRMQIMSPDGPIRSQIPVQRVQQLLKKLWHEDGLANVENVTLKQNLEDVSIRKGLNVHIPGSAETVLRIRTANQAKELRCHSVGVSAVRFPEVQEIRAMAAAQRRLENVRAVTSIGGDQEAKNLATMATRILQDEHGLNMYVTTQDLSMVRALPDGSRYCQFVVADKTEESKVQLISVVEAPGHQPVVEMVGNTITR